MQPDLQHGPRPRHPRPPAVRLRLRRVLSRGGGARPGLAAHPGVRGVGLAAGVGGGIRLHARRRAVRFLPLHGRHPRAGAVRGRRAAHRLAVVHVSRLRGLLAGPRRPRQPRRGVAARGDGRRLDDAAGRRDRSDRRARRPLVPWAHLLLCGGGRVLRRAARELRRLGARGHARHRRLPRPDPGRSGNPAGTGNGVILRGACVQFGGDGVDPRVGPAGPRPAPARRDRRRAVRCATTAGRWAGHGESEGMSVPLSQMWTVATYVLKQRLRRNPRYPLVLMLEPLFRCNLACAGCGKIQYPGHILRKHLSVEQCLAAVEECGAPMVSIPGGEPLMYPEIGPLVAELVARRKYVYLCTNAILLKEKLEEGLFTPSKYLSFSVHMDGLREEHDEAVCREGVYDQAVEGIRAALRRGFRVTTNTTLFDGASAIRMQMFFDEMMDLGVEGMMLSPGYSYSKAPDQEHFLRRQKTHELFSKMLSNPKKGWKFNQSLLFLQFLMGKWDFECTPWGNPTYNIFGWQRSCYLLQERYAKTFKELMETTRWEGYGHKSGNEKCKDCMVHCGYEPTAVHHAFTSWKGFKATVEATLTGRL